MSLDSKLDAFAVQRKTVEIDGLRLLYRDTETSGPLILSLHGRFGRGETWLDFICHYSDQFRIVAPDQRGHGLSDKPRGKYTSEELAQDAAGLIEKLDCGPAIRPGSILLLHPMHPTRQESLKALPIIIEELKERGFKFVTLQQLLEHRAMSAS